MTCNTEPTGFRIGLCEAQEVCWGEEKVPMEDVPYHGVGGFGPDE